MRRSRSRAVAAPQQTNQEGADADRVAAARVFIRERLTAADAGLLTIGNYVLDEFFDGEPATYAARGRKDVSLRALLKGAGTLDFPISTTGISNALGLAVVTRELGETSAFSRLPQSLAIEILPLRDPKNIEGLAVDIIDLPEITVREVRQIVRDMKPKRSAGRPAKPRLVQAVEALACVLGDGPTSRLELASDEVAALSVEQRARVRLAVGHMREHLSALQEALAAEARPSSDVGTLWGTDTSANGVAGAPPDINAALAVVVSS